MKKRYGPPLVTASDVVRETFILNLPGMDYEKGFNTFVNWAVYGELFNYSDMSGQISNK